jgi:hypothetical protein
MLNEQRNNPAVVELAFGRAFYAAGSTVYFSKLIDDDIGNIGKCYQVNDPTADDISDLVATDGGEIQIDGSQFIKRLHRFLSGILIFAENGVWYLSGPDSGFTATAYSLRRITTFGLFAVNSVVNVGSAVMYISDTAVHVIQINEQGVIQELDLSTTSIRSWFLANLRSPQVASVYSRERNEVWFLTGTPGHALVYDTRTQGFYPQRFSASSSQPVIWGIGNAPEFTVCSQSSSGLSTCTLSNPQFRDFGQSTEAFLLTWPESLGKFSHIKAISSCTVVLNRTEKNVVGYGEQGYVFDLPSSCLFTAMWDHDSSNAFKRHTTEMNVYRQYRRGFIPDSYPSPVNDGQAVVTSRFPVSGSGYAVQYRFRPAVDQDMQLLGYSVDYKMKGRQ